MSGKTRLTRGILNLDKAMYRGAGVYGFPVLPVCRYEPQTGEEFIDFNFVRGCQEPEQHSVSFFIDDYQFERVWTQPDRYLTLLKRFKAVCAPDFSTYRDWPRAVQVFNQYRNHWLGRYWSDNGVQVIPSVTWMDADSFSFCFDGVPKRSTVAVSSKGCLHNIEDRAVFMRGYGELLRRLEPTCIVFFGDVPLECEGNIVHVPSVSDKFKADRRRTDWLQNR